jgi:hypothetical protein
VEKHGTITAFVDDDSPVVSRAAHPLLDQEFPNLAIDQTFLCAGYRFAQVFILNLALARLSRRILQLLDFHGDP